MPRGPRLDAPDTLPHVRVRGIEGRAIFRDVASFIALCYGPPLSSVAKYDKLRASGTTPPRLPSTA